MRSASSGSVTGSMRPSRSTYARPGPLSITSVTAGSASNGSSGPRPDDLVGELRQQTLEAGGREQRLFASQQVDETVAQRVGR